jgi:hypothetical protein
MGGVYARTFRAHRLTRENRGEARHDATMSQESGFDPTIPPSGTGCVECLATPDGWWFHLRRCVQCGHIGCCDQSPSQHASKHAAESQHNLIHSFEPDEDWFYDYEADEYGEGPPLAPPEHHPVEQPVPGPDGRVPPDWENHLN